MESQKKSCLLLPNLNADGCNSDVRLWLCCLESNYHVIITVDFDNFTTTKLIHSSISLFMGCYLKLWENGIQVSQFLTQRTLCILPLVLWHKTGIRKLKKRITQSYGATAMNQVFRIWCAVKMTSVPSNGFILIAWELGASKGQVVLSFLSKTFKVQQRKIK